jgi:hypothetical protein
METHMSASTARNAQLHAELDAITAEFGLAAPSSEAGTAMATLDATIAGTEFASASTSELTTLSALNADGDPLVDEMFFGWIKDKARKLIEKLIGLAKRYRNCPKCIGHVTAAVASFKSGSFASAIASGIKAVSCFRNCAN